MSKGHLLFIVLTVSLLGVGASAQSSDLYLPLNPGNRWVLRSHAVSKPIVFEVLRADSAAVLLRFDNPWISSQLKLIAREGRYYVDSLTMNGQTAQMPPDTLYWDFTAREKQQWSSAIGSLEVLGRHRTVEAMGRTFKDCIEIQETNKQGNKLFWTFAPKIGFVQFGEGKGAFVLETFSTESGSRTTAPSPPEPSREEKTSLQTSRVNPIRVALAANPFANEPYSPDSVHARFRQARDAGINLIYVSPKWNEVETSRSKYKFDDIRFQISEAADENLPAVLHIRVIDTNQRSLPPDLVKKPLDGQEIATRLDSLLEGVIPLLQNRVKYFLIGNEIDGYFKQHPDEVRAYARLVNRAAIKIKGRVPGAQVSASTTFDGVPLLATLLLPIADQTDFLALTYYPLTPEFIVRDPSVVDSDFPRIFATAGKKRIFLQEVGYPTSPVNQSSEEKQAELFGLVLDAVAANADRFIGIKFTFMSDFSDTLVKSFATYYNMPGADRFRAFLKTLGMFDDRGRPKKSWSSFAQKVRSLT
jgi:hypothetical protein